MRKKCSTTNNPLSTEPVAKKVKASNSTEAAAEAEKVSKALRERLEEQDSNRREVQEKLYEVCEKMREGIDNLEERINNELRERFTAEDSRLQAALSDLQAAKVSEVGDKISAAFQKAKAELIVMQKYDLKDIEEFKELTKMFKLTTEKVIVTDWLDVCKPRDLKVSKVSKAGRVFLNLTRNAEQEKVLSENKFEDAITYKALLQKKDCGEEFRKEYPLRKDEDDRFSFVPDFLEAETTYTVKAAVEIQGGKKSEWSEEAEFITPEFSECCVWKGCPRNVNEYWKYAVDKKNPRVATKTGSYGDHCTIIGNTTLPHNKVTSWSIRLLSSRYNDGRETYIGVAPSDIDQNNCVNYYKYGWYFDCYASTLWSGPPHNFSRKKYGSSQDGGQCVHTGDSVGVVMDTTKGELSFVVNGVNLGVAYEGIPLDKPLVPCVLLGCKGDAVELNI